MKDARVVDDGDSSRLMLDGMISDVMRGRREVVWKYNRLRREF